MHIGLIGGIGPAATDVYYRGLIRAAAEAGRELNATIVHADAPTLLANLLADRTDEQVAIYMRLADRLAQAGAECVAVPSIAGHFCIDAFAQASPLPVLDITHALSAWLAERGTDRVGILGTRPVMASGMYGKLAPVEVIAPEGDELARVHDAYVALVSSGEATPELRTVFVEAGRAMMERGAEAIMLGGTDLNAAFDADPPDFPLVDCARIHVDAIAMRI